MATKRYAAVDPTSGTGPPPKKLSLTMPPLDIGPASGEDDLDLKVLQVGVFNWVVATLQFVFTIL